MHSCGIAIPERAASAFDRFGAVHERQFRQRLFAQVAATIEIVAANLVAGRQMALVGAYRRTMSARLADQVSRSPKMVPEKGR